MQAIHVASACNGEELQRRRRQRCHGIGVARDHSPCCQQGARRGCRPGDQHRCMSTDTSAPTPTPRTRWRVCEDLQLQPPEQRSHHARSAIGPAFPPRAARHRLITAGCCRCVGLRGHQPAMHLPQDRFEHRPPPLVRRRGCFCCCRRARCSALPALPGASVQDGHGGRRGRRRCCWCRLLGAHLAFDPVLLEQQRLSQQGGRCGHMAVQPAAEELVGGLPARASTARRTGGKSAFRGRARPNGDRRGGDGERLAAEPCSTRLGFAVGFMPAVEHLSRRAARCGNACVPKHATAAGRGTHARAHGRVQPTGPRRKSGLRIIGCSAAVECPRRRSQAPPAPYPPVVRPGVQRRKVHVRQRVVGHEVLPHLGGPGSWVAGQQLGS